MSQLVLTPVGLIWVFPVELQRVTLLGDVNACNGEGANKRELIRILDPKRALEVRMAVTNGLCYAPAAGGPLCMASVQPGLLVALFDLRAAPGPQRLSDVRDQRLVHCLLARGIFDGEIVPNLIAARE
jgi:hypothetical protein